MEFTRMNVGQMRRQAMERTQVKEQQSKDYQNQIDNMSKHNVGGLFDLKSIKKAQSTKVIQERFYDQDRVNKKFVYLISPNKIKNTWHKKGIMPPAVSIIKNSYI